MRFDRVAPFQSCASSASCWSAASQCCGTEGAKACRDADPLHRTPLQRAHGGHTEGPLSPSTLVSVSTEATRPPRPPRYPRPWDALSYSALGEGGSLSAATAPNSAQPAFGTGTPCETETLSQPPMARSLDGVTTKGRAHAGRPQGEFDESPTSIRPCIGLPCRVVSRTIQ